MPDEETMSITIKRYEELREAEEFLNALLGAGVDNWEGYDAAQESIGGG